MGVQPQHADLQQALYFESEQYGDIVQEDFLDSYRNLTYKGEYAWVKCLLDSYRNLTYKGE